MPFALLLIGAVVLVVAIRDTYGSLGQALSTDIPGFAPFGLAIAGIGAIGFVPAMKNISKWALLLLFGVYALKNYSAILSGFSGSTSTAQATTSPQTPAQAYASNPQAAIPAADVAGVGTTAGSSGSTSVASALSTYTPNSYVTAFLANAGFGGA